MNRTTLKHIIKEGFLMATAEQQKQLQAVLQQIDQMDEEIDISIYNQVLNILRNK
jgi:hypothetical protein